MGWISTRQLIARENYFYPRRTDVFLFFINPFPSFLLPMGVLVRVAPAGGAPPCVSDVSRRHRPSLAPPASAPRRFCFRGNGKLGFASAPLGWSTAVWVLVLFVCGADGVCNSTFFLLFFGFFLLTRSPTPGTRKPWRASTRAWS